MGLQPHHHHVFQWISYYPSMNQSSTENMPHHKFEFIYRQWEAPKVLTFLQSIMCLLVNKHLPLDLVSIGWSFCALWSHVQSSNLTCERPLSSVQTLLIASREDNLRQKGRYEVGLEKLANSSQQVAVMQVELTELMPKLIETVRSPDMELYILEVWNTCNANWRLNLELSAPFDQPAWLVKD